MIDPGTLTGEQVRELRTRYGMRALDFQHMAGIGGKSGARIYNIEKNDSWKEGDREAVARALEELEARGVPPKETKARTPRRTASTAAQPIVACDGECDEELSDEELYADVQQSEPEPSTQPIVMDDGQQGYHLDDVMRQVEGDAYIITNGQARTWKRCRRAWWLGWYRQLTPRHEDLTNLRSTGNRVHRALAMWYVPEGQVRVDPRDALERVIVEDWSEIVRLAADRGMDEMQTSQLAEKFNQSAALERAMIEGYVQWLKETGADSDLRVIASETALAADLGEVEVNGQKRKVRTVGLLDARAYREHDKVRQFIDHKTVGSLTEPVSTLPMNEQMLHYMLLEFLNTHDGEARCDGALYNMLRRVKRTPRANPPFYDRVSVHHSEVELESYKRRLLATTRDILFAVEALDRGDDPLDVVYPSPTSDCRWQCDFFAVCNMFDDGSRVEDALSQLYQVEDPMLRYTGRES